MSTEPGDDRSLYDRLGVEREASDADITRAYRRLAREHHPDSSPTGGSEAFSELTDAYDVLRDPARRRAYDDTRSTRRRAADAAAGVRIPVHHATPRQARAASRPADGFADRHEPHPLELPLTFDQAALGTTATVTIPGDQLCETCGGSGTAAHQPCAGCRGSGTFTRQSGGITIRNECGQCGGTGRRRPGVCTACGGSGLHSGAEEVTVKVPAGVHDGARLRITRRGQELTAVVRVGEHPYFTRDGDDLRLRVPIRIDEAALGAVVTVPTLTTAVAVRVPAGTSHGRTLRVRGRGISRPGHPGDLLLTIDIVTPTELNDRQRAALAAFAAAAPTTPRDHLWTSAQ